MTPDENLLHLFKAEMSAQLSTLELKLVREIQANDQLNRGRHDEIKKIIAPYSEQIASVRAGIADLKDEQDDVIKPDIKALQFSDRRWAGITVLISAVISGVGGWIAGGNR